MPNQNDDPGRKVFCISMQRNGTTSVGRFFRDFGFRWAGWPADRDGGWSSAWYAGNFEHIFSSHLFRDANAFEDSPWWLPDFYKVLFHRFPESVFILMTRDPDAWFESMLAHSSGNVIGDNREHCKVYRRELEFFELLEAGEIDDRPDNSGRMMTMVGRSDHYKNQYRLHNLEVQDFFSRLAPHRLHHGTLEDPLKWQRIGAFLGIDVPEGYESRLNASPRPTSKMQEMKHE